MPLDEKGVDLNQKVYKERGQVLCLVWTVGDDYPVAFFVVCELSGLGSYSNTLYDKFEARVLGYGSARTAREQVEESLGGLTTDISAAFLEARDKAKQSGTKRESDKTKKPDQ